MMLQGKIKQFRNGVIILLSPTLLNSGRTVTTEPSLKILTGRSSVNGKWAYFKF